MFNFMDAVGQNCEPYQRVCVIEFDEMKVCANYEYDKKSDEVVGPHQQMQVVMVRGLFSNWKQPVFVYFDTKITLAILSHICIISIMTL